MDEEKEIISKAKKGDKSSFVNLPEKKQKLSIKETFFMKKTLTFLIPILMIVCGGIIVYKYVSTHFTSVKIQTCYDMPNMVRVNNTEYHAGSEVITDERIIDREIGEIKIRLDEHSKVEENSSWASTVAEPGTKVYSIKGLNEKEAIALKIHDQFVLFRVKGGPRQSLPIFTEDILKAEKIVVKECGIGQDEVKEIKDRETINKITSLMKKAEKLSDLPTFHDGKLYEYYFVVRDSKGIGKVAYKYFATMQDINFDGYIRTDGEIYKLNPEFNKLITSPFGSIQSSYDEKLGGKKQVYKAFIGAKIIFRSLIKEESAGKSEITLLDKGADIWQNGSQIKDNLKGNYKLQIIMKDTTVQKNVIEEATKEIYRTRGAVSINFTEGSTKDTLVIYICFDTKPEYFISEGDNSLVIEMKQ